MRRVAWTLLLFVGCSASPPPAAEAVPAATTSGSETQYCFIRERCVPCAGAGSEVERCARILGALPRSDEEGSLRARDDAPASPPLPLPVGRSDATVTVNDPALASAASTYQRLVTAPFSLETPSSDVSTGIHALVENVRRASAIAVELAHTCEPVEAVAGPSQIAALVLHADALDFVASRIASATLPVPLDVLAQTQDASPEIRAEIDRQFDQRIAEVLAPQAGTVYCTAARLYQAALALEPTQRRATTQLAAYGDAFIRSCTP